MKLFNILRYAVLILTFLDISGISGYIIPTAYKNGGSQGVAKKQALKLRNNYNNLLCNEKFIYMKYLIGIRNFKKLYRIIKDNSNIDIQNIINIINYINTTQIANINENNYNNSIFVNNSLFHNTTLFINNTGINSINNNSEKIAKNLILSNVYIDVSNVKYIQISTKNDTLIVELDKNNADTASPNNIHNLMYDISNIETLISSMSLLLKVLNIN
jgi:hypothetical protein